MKPISIHTFVFASCAALLLAMSTHTRADGMYKHVDERGRVTYSNTPIKGGKKVDLPPLSTLPLPKVVPVVAKPTPKVEVEPEKEARRKTLLEEIAKEEKALEAAKLAAKEGSEKPEVFQHTQTVVGKDGKSTKVTKTGRNVAAYEEKMKQFDDDVALHEKNLARLKAELLGQDSKKEDKK